MATNQSSGPAGVDAEKEVGEDCGHHINLSTRFVRDITYKLIPFLGFSLVIFSIGGILVSTLSFNKPLSHQGVLVISILLLSFFLLFGVGFMYLHYRKSPPHPSKCFDTMDGLRQDVQSVSGIRHSDDAKNPVPRGADHGLIHSDTLRGQAPSPNTYKKGAEESDGVTQSQDVLHELRGSTNQRGHKLAQQHEQQTNGSDRASPLNPARRAGPKAGQFSRDGGHNGSIQTNITSKLDDRRACAHPITHDTDESPLGSSSVGNFAQPPSMVRTTHHAASPRNPSGIPVPPRPAVGPRDIPRHSTSNQVPSLKREVLGPALPTSPDSTGVRSPQFHGPALEARSGNTAPPNPQNKARERQRLDGQDDVSPWPRVPAKGNKMNKAHDQPSITPGQGTTGGPLAPPIGTGLASVQASLESEAQNARTKEPPLYMEYDVPGSTEEISKTHREELQVVGPGWLTRPRGPLRVINGTGTDEGRNPPEPSQATQKPTYEEGSKAYIQRRSVSETAGGMRRDEVDPGLPRASTCNRILGFDPRHLSAVPEPLNLANKEARGHRDDARETPMPIPTPALVARPRLPTTPYRPRIYAGGGGEDGEEVHGRLVRASGQKPMRGQGGGGPRRPQVPQRSSSRKSRRGGSSTSRDLHTGLRHDGRV